ncbi:MAG TPA: hypothetical protein VFN25_04020 [Dokdonella sp.]|uniref:hypothetical protein n=1 Tax=Dokdonella sp. TaxID=2291710 RepID=UPI002D7E1CA6|nr:hypothetical protein [Dokdonella sp.]HET9032055.1 hypothetical protein [Dokdonella sp.]
MKLKRSSLFWLIAPLSLTLWLLLVTPTRWLGIETSVLGTGGLLLTAWLGFWLSTQIPQDKDSAVSPAEVRQWVALLFTAAIAAFFIFQADVILRAQNLADLRGVGRTFAMLIIGWLIFSSLLRQRARAGVQEDERDREVQIRGDQLSHGAICVFVIGLALTLGLSPSDRLGFATPIALAHLLIFGLVLANLISCVACIWQYRRAAT